MVLLNPYPREANQYRGSLHIHSTFSPCGWHGVEEIALAYRDYDFLAISDHDRVTTETEALSGHVLFRATEVSGARHMLLAGKMPLFREPLDHIFSTAHYGELAQFAADSGNLALATHPMRIYGQHWSVEELVETPGLLGMEVFSGDGIHVDQDVGFVLWDQVLTAGRWLWGFGNDDFHHWGQERRVWNVVLAQEKTPEAILSALRQGSFYISSGFGFSSITTQGNAVTFTLRGNTPEYRDAYRYLTLYGRGGQVLAEQTGHFQSFTYTARGDEGYIRAEAYVRGGYGAFSQPIRVEA